MDLLRERARSVGHHLARCADAPDTSGMNRAAEASAALGKEALDWYKQLYDQTAPERAAAAQRSQAVSDAQLEAMRTATEQSRQYADYNRGTFQPLEREIVAAARGFDSQDNQDAAAGRATTDVAKAFADQRGTIERNIARSGMGGMSDAQRAQIESDFGASEALASAGAANRAREQVRTVGRAMKMDAASLGRGLPSAQATQASLAQGSGSIAASTGMQPLQATQSGAAMMGQGFNQAMSGWGQSGNLYGQEASIQQKAGDNNGLWQGLGSIAGGFLARSDVAAKRGFEPVDSESALDVIRSVPVEAWNYKDEPAGTPKHVGPMAQNVAAAAGMEVAPGGKSIDLVSMNGISMAAIKALDDKVNRIAAAAGFGDGGKASASGAKPAAMAGM